MTIQNDISIIGSILIDPDCLSDVLEYVDENDFSSSVSSEVFKVAKGKYLNGEPIDPVIIRNELSDRWGAETISKYMIECMESTPTSANVIEYCKLLRNCSRLRMISSLADECIDIKESSKWEDVATELISKLQNVCQAGTISNLQKGESWAEDFIEEEKKIVEDPAAAYVKTSYRLLDHVLGGGMHNSGMYVIGARPGMGKTTLALNIAENVASRNIPVLFVSMEMSSRQIMCKRIAMQGKVTYEKVMSGELTFEEQEYVFYEAQRLAKLPMAVNEKSGLNVQDISLLAQKVKGLKLIVIDYIGLIRPSKSGRSRYEDYTNISADIKLLAKKLNIPILALSQLNRVNTSRTYKRPTMADLRDTGAIEQDADAIILLHRDAYYDVDTDKQTSIDNEIQLIIAKNRHAGTGTIKMTWDGCHGLITKKAEDDLSDIGGLL